MKKLLPFLLLLFTIFNVQAQEIEIIEPCDINKFLTDDGYYYARGVASSSNLEMAKSKAFLFALINLSSDYEQRFVTDTESRAFFFYTGPKHLSTTDILEKSVAAALHYSRDVIITDDGHEYSSHFVNTAWLSYASECKDFEIMCTDVLKDEYGEYKAYYVLRISKQKAKKLFDEFNDFVDG